MPHIIKQQLIDLSLDNGSNAFRIQHLFGEHYRNEIIPILETVFNEYCGEDEVLQVDRLEIDLGIIREVDLEKNRWDDVLLAAFRASLRENMTALSVTKRLVRRSVPMNHCMQWISYMQTGYLPWNTLQSNEAWYQAVLETLATDSGGVALLRRLISEDPKFVQRIVLQHDAVFLRKLVEILTAQNQRQLASAIEDVHVFIRIVQEGQGQPLPSRAGLIGLLWRQTLEAAATSQFDLSTETIARRLLEPYTGLLPYQRELQEQLILSMTVLEKMVGQLVQRKRDVSGGNAPSGPLEEVSQLTEGPQLEDGSAKRGSPSDPSDDMGTPAPEATAGQSDNTRPTASEDNERAGQKETLASKTDNKKNTEILSAEDNRIDDGPVASVRDSKTNTPGTPALPDGKEKEPVSERKVFRSKDHDESRPVSTILPSSGIYIRNAGVVLTHPFLAFLFRRLTWMEKNTFVDEAARQKAVFLLHYVATGETVAPEYDLVLCKLLCGYPLDEPLPLTVELTDEQLTEATDMLTAIIQQWSKLQNTSVAGLREGFLQRGGKLLLQNERPLVQVEAGAIDILLDYLPWNLSVIRLPWMDGIVRVEWR